MKRHSNTIHRLLAAVTFVAALTVTPSCRRELDFTMPDLRPDERICFGSEGLDLSVETKATEVTSLSSFYVSAVTGSAGSEVSAWTSTQFNQVPASSPAVYSGDKYWPAVNPEYKFYGANLALNFAADGTYVNASNATDVVCAYLSSPTYRTKNTLSFEHIFARLCRVDVAAQTGYTISDILMYITPKTGGTYNLRTGAGHTDGTGWSSIATGSATLISNKTGATNNDIYMVPGRYSITCSWVSTDPSGASVTHTNESSTLLIKGGATNNISVVLGGDIVLGVDLQDYCEYDYRDNLDYLTFYCDEAGTIGWKCSTDSGAKTIQYSKDFGATWTNLTSTTSGATVAVSAGDIVWFRGSNNYYSSNTYNNYFTLSGKTHVYGNVNSLTGNNTSVANHCFACLFKDCINLYTYDIKKIILPATTLASNCYACMFMGCTSMTAPPEINAENAQGTIYCCYRMFYGCTSLKTAPRLPANNLNSANNCYEEMFCNCTSLLSAPELPATSLPNGCYSSMFKGCTSLNFVPDLNATTGSTSCYSRMFEGCTSLKNAPGINFSSNAPSYSCYSMFKNCTSLKHAPELFAIVLENDCYEEMFMGCTGLLDPPVIHATTMGYTTSGSNCCMNMFNGCTSLTSSPELFVTDVVYRGFSSMFSGCSNLTVARKIHATSVSGSYGLQNMFGDCISLVVVPDLEITTMSGSDQQAMSLMFKNCSSLATAPALPATTLGDSCYSNMFKNCINLKKAPELPATTLADGCYSQMFYGCTNLNVAPTLPAITLVSDCYYEMFNGCSSLNYIKAFFTTTPGYGYTRDWVSGVASFGTFVKNSAATWNVSGVNGIPSGWAVETARYFTNFGGVNISPAPLYYDGSMLVIKDDDWNHTSYGTVYGNNNGSYFFDFLTLGRFFDSRRIMFDSSSGDIDNNGLKVSYGGNDDWRMPTRAEWCTLTTGEAPGVSRVGSTVNGNSGAKYALIQLTGVSHAGSTTPNGILLFPDGATITGKALSGINNNTQTTGVTAAELQNFLDQGCAFLPGSGHFDNNWMGGGALARYWSATEYSGTAAAYTLNSNGLSISPSNVVGKSAYCPVYLVRDADY